MLVLQKSQDIGGKRVRERGFYWSWTETTFETPGSCMVMP